MTSTSSDRPDMPDWRLLDAWLAGSATPAERAEVERWMAVDPRNASMMQSLKAGLSDDVPRPDVDRAWAATRERMHEGAASRRSSLRWRVAAAIVAVVGLGALALRASSARMVEIVTTAGAREGHVLPDGSRVTLNAASRLRYSPRRFNGARDVQLEGEALFEVAHDTARPFRVLSRGGVATDLGTRFVVRGYPELDHLVVGVTEGRVSLRHENGADSVVLDPGMVGRLPASGAPSVDTAGNADRLTAWTTGALSFTAAPIGEVAAELSRHYGISVRVDSALASRRLTASFQQESADQVLGVIAVGLGIRYERQGDTVVLRAPPR